MGRQSSKDKKADEALALFDALKKQESVALERNHHRFNFFIF